jgi:ribonuclease HII
MAFARMPPERRRTTAERRIVGVDEAGRGSTVGPLVVGAFAVSESALPELPRLGVRDSKKLSPARRSEIRAALPALGACRSIALAPRTIDRYVAREELNDLELFTFARLVRSLAPDLAIVDACDPDAGRFGRRLSALVGAHVDVVARHRADEEFPVVGAASIVAKVRRDRALEGLRQRLGNDLGSGYPSDPRTQAFVESTVRRGEPPPEWLRVSWAPVQRVMRARSARTLDEFVT